MDYLNFNTSTYLDEDSIMRTADITFKDNSWMNFEIGERGIDKKSGSYLVPTIPVEFHCHGIGKYDFSNFDDLNLEHLNTLAFQEGIYCVPSIFLPHNQLDNFLRFMQHYHAHRQKGFYTNILGFSLEGPLLASFAGTPEQGNWAPTKQEWATIASCGELGLIYTVLSPDAMTENSFLKHLITPEHPSIDWIVQLLVEHNIKPALRHFQRSYPEETAALIRRVITIAQKASNYAGATPIITDHLFNDMPNNFKHAYGGRLKNE